MKLQDIVAASMTIILLLAIIAFTLLAMETPEVLQWAFCVSVGWVFSRSINGANGALKRRVHNGR